VSQRSSAAASARPRIQQYLPVTRVGQTVPMPKPPTFVMRQLRKPYVDYALCLLLKRRRMALQPIDPTALWPEFETAEVTVGILPKGDWSAPTNDTLVLMKLAAAARPRRILELGSYRGYSGKAMLENAPADATLTAVDIDPQHGEAYRDTALADRVDRRVGPIGLEIFTPDEIGSFDLVFVDADHSRAAASHDTEIALRMVSEHGTVLWHDYANWGYFTGDCGVPEVLNDLATRLPVGHLIGSNIAIHRPSWARDRTEFDDAVRATNDELRLGHWNSGTARRYA
jgi:predicted O-methyltransferase YrrM